METQDNTIIETPSSMFSYLAEDVKKDIEEAVKLWKNASMPGDRINITTAIKKKYKKNPDAYEYFSCLKVAKEDGTLPVRKYNARHPEAVAKEEFTKSLRYFLQKYFKSNCLIDQNSKIFLLDSHYNLPNYFWARMNSQVIPKLIKEYPNEKKIELHAWFLANGIMKKYESELGSRLQNTEFQDLKHVCNTIIQFFNKYMLPTYRELLNKARKEIIDKKKNEIKIQNEQMLEDTTIRKRGGGAKEVQKVGFDTTGLL
jgi:hypothetical protein